MKKPKKITKSKLTKRLDKLWGEIIRLQGKCQRCGKTTNLQAAHIYSRRNRATRWIVLNGVCLCSGCHVFWAHLNPSDFVDFVTNRLGVDLYDQLRTLAHSTVHYSVEDMLSIETQLKSALNNNKELVK